MNTHSSFHFAVGALACLLGAAPACSSHAGAGGDSGSSELSSAEAAGAGCPSDVRILCPTNTHCELGDAGPSCVDDDAGPAPECTPPPPGQPSPEGGCCSEWIPCQAGLTCEPDGPVYPGSLGICTRPPACTPGTAGVPSPEGGCCSEWIPCQAGLTCKANGSTYPGSDGICAP